MKRLTLFLASLILAFTILPAWTATQPEQPKPVKITWKKTVVDKVFRSEGVAVADVLKRGKQDIIVGDVWYEAPDWKMHPLRKEKFTSHDLKQYSESFAVFADDFNGDGYPDVIVIPFPGKACYWYENPKNKDELWKEHLLTTSACNETPIYVDLFKTGKRVLVMGWNPGKNGPGEMCYFQPGKDPTQPWERISISGKMDKEAPGSGQFYHGLGCGDVNGDGRDDIITPHGWYEQPEKIDGTPWKFHATKIGEACADMHVMDLGGDGKMDIISSSAHGYGLWWHQQRAGGSFLTKDLFPTPPMLAKEPEGYNLNKEEKELLDAINKAREAQKRTAWQPDAKLCDIARRRALNAKNGQFGKPDIPRGSLARTSNLTTAEAVLDFMKYTEDSHFNGPGLSIGIGVARINDNSSSIGLVITKDSNHFALPGQTHALQCVDINGDGLKDLVTGRRWWAHGPGGDVSPQDPPCLYWFEAKKDKTGVISFTPHLIDDDSGIGTQFAVVDINGDGLLDIVVANKKGVFVFEQVRN